MTLLRIEQINDLYFVLLITHSKYCYDFRADVRDVRVWTCTIFGRY
jgi:hypothetical protein